MDVQKKTHKEWRKEAKKMRRKRVRQSLAAANSVKLSALSRTKSYQDKLLKERLLEETKLEEEMLESKKRHLKWLQDEKEAQKIWLEKKRLDALAVEERKKEQQRILQEWEGQQKKIKEAKAKEKELLEREKEQKAEIMAKIDHFVNSGGNIPDELLTTSETHIGQALCPFFMKVGCCRFGSSCSRNHVQPGISKILILMNFYTHFSLHQNAKNEYDTDINLEYEDSDMYQHFSEFYKDVIPELKSYGKVIFIRVCCNFEQHLRGNTYVEYSTEREALIAYKNLNGRWYGGKQVTVEFTKIPNWHGAICGDFLKKCCPKGKNCNFLHVFRNPKNEFPLRNINKNTSPSNKSNDESVTRSWRWSESPERIIKEHKKRRKHSPDRHDRKNGNNNHGDSPRRSRKRVVEDHRREFRRKRHRSRRRHRSRSSSKHKKESNHLEK